MLLCGEEDRWPAAVLKVPRASAFDDRTLNEHRTLSMLERVLGTDLRQSVPRPLALFERGGISVAVERFVPGRSMSRSLRQRGRPLDEKLSYLRDSARWLSECHRRLEIDRAPWGEDAFTRWVDAPAREYETCVPVSEAERRLFAATRTCARSLYGLPFPLVWQHRDFKPAHVLLDGTSIRVIDWEGARPGPPLCDLLHFLVHWHGAVRGIPAFPGLARLFFASGQGDRISRAAHQAVKDYMQAVGLDARFLPVLLVYTCVELVVRRAVQQRLQGETHDTLRTDSNLQLMTVLSRNVDELFSRDPRSILLG
jgi:aminoglycoside phosphotransferase (APT) family kinase protein